MEAPEKGVLPEAVRGITLLAECGFEFLLHPSAAFPFNMRDEPRQPRKGASIGAEVNSMITRALRTFELMARVWCNVMHPDPAWPIHGYYRCPKCHRRYPVPWESRNRINNPAAQPDDRAISAAEPEFAAAV